MGDPISDAADRVVAAVMQLGLSAALLDWEPSNPGGFWSVVTKRAGLELVVHASRDPSRFAALDYAKPQTSVSLEQLGPEQERDVLLLAAQRLALPRDARGIPFSLVTGETSAVVVAVAVSNPVEAPVAVLTGHGAGPLVPLQTVVLGRSEVAVFGVDGDSREFGRPVLRRPFDEVMQVDLDQRSLALVLDGARHSWRLEHPVDERVRARVAAHAKALGATYRRLVQKTPTSWEFQPSDG